MPQLLRGITISIPCVIIFGLVVTFLLWVVCRVDGNDGGNDGGGGSGSGGGSQGHGGYHNYRDSAGSWA